MLQSLETLWNVALIMLGFGLVIVVHELGHFIAARWAGIRVHAFAVGFGPAIFSYRKGMGVRRGSSEQAYLQLMESERTGVQRTDTGRLSPTEYRLNWVPLGGYVKMLGQEDLNADATSDASDSYQTKPVWKRMIVISAGVVMNVILAGVLFVAVFMVGLPVSSPAVGFVAPGSAAEAAGFRAGDVVVSIDGRAADNFADLQIASAMASKGKEMTFRVTRPGQSESIELLATPKRDEESGLLQLGLGPASGTKIWSTQDLGTSEDAIRRSLIQAGLEGVAPGSTLIAVDARPVEPTTLPSGTQVRVLTPLLDALRASAGDAVEATFESPSGDRTTVAIEPRVQLQRALGVINEDETAGFGHLLGMVPVTRVQTTAPEGDAAGLEPGDLLARVGGVDWPSVPDTIAQVRRAAGGTIEVTLLHPVEVEAQDGLSPDQPSDPAGIRLAGRFWTLVELDAPVSEAGRIGFSPEEADSLPFVTRAPRLARDPSSGEIPMELPADRMFPRILPGMVLERVAGRSITDFADARSAILAAAASEDSSGESTPITLEFGLIDPRTLSLIGSESRTIDVFPSDSAALADLGWSPGPIEVAFAPSEVLMKASDPFHAVAMGTRETLRKVTLAYLTIQRLFEGTVQVRHLKGPVGITHIGSQFAAQGPLYLLFFLALISANLAVINFLPMPIVDGGMFLLLCYEGLRGKPAPIAVQSALNLVGLVLIGGLFLTVTFYDLRGLFGL
ncbi:MAG: site-2 protease family protein [Phycisphaerales bacterium]